jgi:hypothetical protein
MGYSSARTCFERAKSSENEAIRSLAEGLVELSRAIETDIKRLAEELHSRR